MAPVGNIFSTSTNANAVNGKQLKEGIAKRVDRYGAPFKEGVETVKYATSHSLPDKAESIKDDAKTFGKSSVKGAVGIGKVLLSALLISTKHDAQNGGLVNVTASFLEAFYALREAAKEVVGAFWKGATKLFTPGSATPQGQKMSKEAAEALRGAGTAANQQPSAGRNGVTGLGDLSNVPVIPVAGLGKALGNDAAVNLGTAGSLPSPSSPRGAVPPSQTVSKPF
jgi:hypothetical protein